MSDKEYGLLATLLIAKDIVAKEGEVKPEYNVSGQDQNTNHILPIPISTLPYTEIYEKIKE